jgi:hypothetical protein
MNVISLVLLELLYSRLEVTRGHNLITQLNINQL